MERLQNALHRARERQPAQDGGARKTASATSTTPRRRAMSRNSVSDEDIASRWNALHKFQPNPRELQRNRVVSYFGKANSTPFDMMRTKLVQQAKAKGWRRIAITSPTPKCGKTTTTANLAFSLSRQTEMRILVIELDLRRPGMGRVLGLNEPHYFAKALAGEERPEDHMVCYNENLAFGTNVAAAATPSELLQSQQAQDCIDRLEEYYRPDLILFDTAPLLASDDTIGFLEHADAALLIAAAELSTIDEIDVSESEISEVTEVMGIVLNKCRYSSGGYGYDYGYDYGY